MRKFFLLLQFLCHLLCSYFPLSRLFIFINNNFYFILFLLHFPLWCIEQSKYFFFHTQLIHVPRQMEATTKLEAIFLWNTFILLSLMKLRCECMQMNLWRYEWENFHLFYSIYNLNKALFAFRIRATNALADRTMNANLFVSLI